MAKVKFFYCTGTAYAISMFDNALKTSVATQKWFWGDPSVNPELLKNPAYYVEGLGGKTYPWDGEIFNDPFPYMLNQNVWDIARVAYADTTVSFLSNGTLLSGMGASIDDGISKVIARINALPPGTPFALGGYSQGAAVMSGIYNELRSGSLTSRYPDFIGGVMFGNPRRQVNFRGEIGGTWSGAWDVPGSNTGGHGCFPLNSPWGRLSACDGTEWIEFAAPDDIITSTGDSNTGLNWTKGSDALLELANSEYFGQIALQAVIEAVFPDVVNVVLEAIDLAMNEVGTAVNYLIDAVGNQGVQPGAGHTIYPALPPPNSDGTFDVTTQEVTTTYTPTGAESSVKTLRLPRGRLAPTADPEPVSITHTYLKANAPTCYQLALSWLEAKAQQFAVAPIIVPSTGSVGWSTTLVPPAQ